MIAPLPGVYPAPSFRDHANSRPAGGGRPSQELVDAPAGGLKNFIVSRRGPQRFDERRCQLLGRLQGVADEAARFSEKPAPCGSAVGRLHLRHRGGDSQQLVEQARIVLQGHKLADFARGAAPDQKRGVWGQDDTQLAFGTLVATAKLGHGRIDLPGVVRQLRVVVWAGPRRPDQQPANDCASLARIFAGEYLGVAIQHGLAMLYWPGSSPTTRCLRSSCGAQPTAARVKAKAKSESLPYFISAGSHSPNTPARGIVANSGCAAWLAASAHECVLDPQTHDFPA